MGWIGSFLLAICGLPQAMKSLRQGHSKGLSTYFLVLWSVGEVFTLIAVVDLKVDYLLLNYISNLLFLLIIWFYKLYPRGKL